MNAFLGPSHLFPSPSAEHEDPFIARDILSSAAVLEKNPSET